MSKFKDASENIKRLQVMFSGLIELADAMDKVDSLESYAVELEDKKGKLDKDISSLKVSKDNLLKEFEAARVKLSAMMIDNESKAVKMIADAESKALVIIEAAQAKSKEIDSLIDVKIKKYELAAQSLVAELNASDEKLKASELKLKEVNQALEKIKGGI